MRRFFGSFRKAEADDPETFTAGCTRLFTAYAPEVVLYVVDPVTGLPGRSEWLPSIAKVKEALDSRALHIGMQRAREQREREQLAERERELAAAKAKPTREQLLERHGANFGLTEASDASEQRRAKLLEQIAKANRRLLKKECEAAGVDAALGVSPSLTALIKKGSSDLAHRRTK